MTTKYKASNCYRLAIEAVEIIRETDKSVFLPDHSRRSNPRQERREAKKTTYDQWFDSWREAHSYIMSIANADTDRARRRLADAEETLSTVEEMEEPS